MHKIHQQEEGPKGSFYIKNKKETLAEMSYSRAGENLLIIDHTEVDQELRGQGIARTLLDKVVAMARKEKLSVIPLCPFAKNQFTKDKSLHDVLAR